MQNRGKDAKQGRVRGGERLKEKENNRMTSKVLKPLSRNVRKIQNKIDGLKEVHKYCPKLW